MLGGMTFLVKIPVMTNLLQGKLVSLMMDFKLYDSYKAEKKRHMSGNHVKMKIPEYLIELYEGKYTLHYWKEKEDSFPILAKLSKIYLNAPATVEPVE